MLYSDAELEVLAQQLNCEIRSFEEGGYVYIYISELKMPPECIPAKTAALLCPQPHSGYTSRLFFGERIQTPKEVNWNSNVFILGHQWYAISYNNIEGIPLFDMVLNHLRGVAA